MIPFHCALWYHIPNSRERLEVLRDTRKRRVSPVEYWEVPYEMSVLRLQ